MNQIYAGGYIRTSSESQGTKVSPEIQGEDIQKYCDEKGYILVDMYPDIARYRVGRKLIEPSGSRMDRPQFQRMLADAKNGRINCIIAWREDRLYRGYRPMLEVLETLEQTQGLTLELVKEHFDMTIAPLKAWLAKMELSAKNDRWFAGMTGRLRNGKPLGREAYGYTYDKDNSNYWVINEEEAYWVKTIWEWYGEGYTLTKIHDQLVLNNAVQKYDGGETTKTPWSVGAIRNVLKKDYYYTGKMPIKLGDDIIKVDVPTIIDHDIYQSAVERKEKWIKHRSPNRKHKYTTSWLEGLIYCQADGWKLGLNYTYNASRNIPYYEYYRCVYKYHHHEIVDGCVQTIRMNRIDYYVWNKIWGFINNPELFETRLIARIKQIQNEQDETKNNIDTLKERQEQLIEERRKVQSMYRKGWLKDNELDEQMKVIEDEEMEIGTSIGQISQNYSSELERMQELSRIYRKELTAGLQRLGNEPEQLNNKQWSRWSNVVKIILQMLVKRVEVNNNGDPTIVTYINLLNPIQLNSDSKEFVIGEQYSSFQYPNYISVSGTVFEPFYKFEFIL